MAGLWVGFDAGYVSGRHVHFELLFTDADVRAKPGGICLVDILLAGILVEKRVQPNQGSNIGQTGYY